MKEKLIGVIVDDEKSARDVLLNLLTRFCPSIEIADSFSNVEDAQIAIKQINPDVVFLDIEMPNYSGFEIIDFFDTINFEIIFITAYNNYALRAFEVAALDYLLKPIEIDRLQKAVSRLEDNIRIKQSEKKYNLLKKTLSSKSIEQITIWEKGENHFVNTNDIIGIEAQEAYAKVYTQSQKKYVVSKNLKHFENLLCENENFMRVHKSWIINLDYITSYKKNILEIKLAGDLVAKLSKYKKSDFENKLKK